MASKENFFILQQGPHERMTGEDGEGICTEASEEAREKREKEAIEYVTTGRREAREFLFPAFAALKKPS